MRGIGLSRGGPRPALFLGALLLAAAVPAQAQKNSCGYHPVLNPANVQEVLDLGIYGWELSRYSGCWVALKAITENMDSAISADMEPNRIDIEIPEEFSDLPAQDAFRVVGGAI